MAELTTDQVAERLGVAKSTVTLWCRHGRFPKAKSEATPFGAYGIIQAGDLVGFEPPEMGRPRKEPAAAAAKKPRTRKGAAK